MKKKVLLGLLIVLIVFSFATMMLFAMGFCNNIYNSEKLFDKVLELDPNE